MAILTMGPSDDSWATKAPKDGVYVNSDGHRAQFRKDDLMPADYVPAKDEDASEGFDKSARSRETGQARRSRETAD